MTARSDDRWRGRPGRPLPKRAHAMALTPSGIIDRQRQAEHEGSELAETIEFLSGRRVPMLVVVAVRLLRAEIVVRRA